MKILIIIALTLLNGVFSMSEIAVVSTRKARLAGLVLERLGHLTRRNGTLA